jgi:hypothetical protein
MAKRKARAIDEAREYRERVRALYPEPPPEKPLAGLTHERCERFIYLGVSPNETANKLLKALDQVYKDYRAQHGRLPACFSAGLWAVTLPAGETFHAFHVVRRGSMVGDTEEAMVPFVEAGVQLLRDYAAATGRRTGMIENGTTFVCDDGRHIALDECSCRRLTDDDYYPHRRKKKTES